MAATNRIGTEKFSYKGMAEGGLFLLNNANPVGTQKFSYKGMAQGTIYQTNTLTITISSPLTDGTDGIPYSQVLAETGGNSPFTWTVSAGAVPTGLTLQTNGTLDGTPSGAGAYNFTAKVTDVDGFFTTQAFDITINGSGGGGVVFGDPGIGGGRYMTRIGGGFGF